MKRDKEEKGGIGTFGPNGQSGNTRGMFLRSCTPLSCMGQVVRNKLDKLDKLDMLDRAGKRIFWLMLGCESDSGLKLLNTHTAWLLGQLCCVR